MSMTFAQAEVALASGSYNTVALIAELFKQVSGAVEGATSQTTYLLLNGKMPSGEFASEAASAIQLGGGGVGVTKSEVGQLVNSLRDRNSALYEAFSAR